MRTAKDYTHAERISRRTEIIDCPHCETTLRRSHIAWRKYIQRMDGLYHVTSYAHKCPNPECHYGNVPYRSTEAETLSLKGKSFGLDVIGEIGHQRFRENHSVPKIHKDLREHNIDISEREVYHLIEVYLQLLKSGMEIDSTIYGSIEKNGGIALAIDAVQPERGNETLYVIMDVISGIVLHAANLVSSSTEEIEKLLNKVKDQGLPVIAVISDYQLSIWKAVEKVFPETPHQFCHFHLLTNAAKPTVELDRKMKKDIKKRIRGIKPIEKKAMELRPQVDRKKDKTRKGKKRKNKKVDKWEYILRICEMMRHLLVLASEYPLKPGGLAVFERLKALNENLRKYLAKDPDPLIVRLEKITRIWKEFSKENERISALFEFVWKLSGIFGTSSSTDEAKTRVGLLLKEVETAFDKSRDELFQYCLCNLHYHIINQWRGLFHCFDNPLIPNTNNRLETQIGDMKKHFRMIAGRLTWVKYMIRFGPELAFIVPHGPRGEYEDLLKRVAYEDFDEHWKVFLERKERFSTHHRIARDFFGALQELSEAAGIE